MDEGRLKAEFLVSFDTYSDAIFRFCLVKTSQKEVAEDLVQETLLAVHLKRESYWPGSPLSAWVFGIARFKLVDMWRRHGRQSALNDPFDELDDSQMPTADMGEEGAGRDLEGLLETLPVAQKSQSMGQPT